MVAILSRRWSLLVVLPVLFPVTGNAKSKQPDPALPRAATIQSSPAQNQRAIMDALGLFGKQLRVEYTSSGEHDIVIEIAPILNKTGVDKELPSEVSQWVREAIAKIGYPLRSYEAVPTTQLVRPIFPSAGPIDRPPHPAPTYRVTGALERFFEREVRGKELEFYLRAGGGSSSTDGQMKRTNRATVTRVTLSLTLEQPDGLDLATATYLVDIVKTDADRSWGVFIGGTGVGGSRNLLTAEDPGGAIFDAASAALMTIIGRAPQTLVPYYRCSTIFPEDETVNELERRTLNRMITSELLDRIKPYVYLSDIAGTAMDMQTQAVTSADLSQIAAQLHSRHLDPAVRGAYAEYAYELWHDVPITKASDRLEKRIEEVIRFQKQKLEDERKEAEAKKRQAAEEAAAAEARDEAWSHIGPSHFGWRATGGMVLLDLSKVPDASFRAKIVAAVRTCAGCSQVKTDEGGAVVAVRMFPASPVAMSAEQTRKAREAVEHAVRGTRLNVGYQWVGDPTKRLCVSSK